MSEYSKTIIDHSYDYAKELLEETKQCYPFGAFIDRAGQVHPLEFDVEGSKTIPDNETVRESLRKYCRTEYETGKILAWGLTYEASVVLKEGDEPIETLLMEIYSKEEDNLPYYHFPFKLTEDGVEFYEPFAVKR